MKVRAFRVVLQSLPLLLSSAGMARPQGRIVEPADIIVVHGHVYTENPKQPWAQAVAIRHGKITAVGDDPEIERRRGMGTKVINAGGKLVLPGFVDCHIHFMDGSLSLGRVNLEGAKDPSEIQKRLRQYAVEHPGDDWILGRGWNYAMFGPEALPHKKDLDLFDEMRRRGDLSVRLYIAYFLNPPELRPQDLQAIEHARKKFHDDWIDAEAVKFMVDGVVESHTAAMLEPYSDGPSLKGKLFWEPSKYKAAVVELDKHGLQLFTHAIGDYAVRTALDAYENAETQNHKKGDRRPRIEHIETIAQSDIPRFGKLGVIASMQPLHAYPDSNTLDVWARNAGPDRASRAWAWKSIADAGGRLAFGSDWPVVTLNPWEGMQTAVTRQTAEATPANGFVPEQRLTVPQAVEAYTLGAAFAGRREKTEGSLEVGKLGDLIIISQDIFNINPHKIEI